MNPYKGNGEYIFISYSHKDKDEVFKIIERLLQDGYRVWYDEGIDPGSEWDNNIAKHIKECSFFVAFVSKHFIKSNNCIEELSYARDLNKGRLLVFLADVCLPDGITMRTSRLQSIHKYKYKSFDDFIRVFYSAQGMGDNLTHTVSNSIDSPELQTAAEKQPSAEESRNDSSEQRSRPKRKGKAVVLIAAIVFTLVFGTLALTHYVDFSALFANRSGTEAFPDSYEKDALFLPDEGEFSDTYKAVVAYSKPSGSACLTFGPDSYFEPVTKIENGTRVKVLSLPRDGWVLVNSKNGKGWILLEDISRIKSEEDTTAADSTQHATQANASVKTTKRSSTSNGSQTKNSQANTQPSNGGTTTSYTDNTEITQAEEGTNDTAFTQTQYEDEGNVPADEVQTTPSSASTTTSAQATAAEPAGEPIEAQDEESS